MASPQPLKRSFSDTGLDSGFERTQDEMIRNVSKEMPQSTPGGSDTGDLPIKSTERSRASSPVPSTSNSITAHHESSANDGKTLSGTPTKKRKLALEEKEVRKIEKEFRDRQKAEERAKRDQEKEIKDRQRAEEKAKKEEEKRARDLEKEERRQAKEAQLKQKEEEKQKKEDEKSKKERVSLGNARYEYALLTITKSQLRLNAFFVRPLAVDRSTSTSPTRDSAASSRRSSVCTMSGAEAEPRGTLTTASSQKPRASDYAQQFPPFFVQSHTAVAAGGWTASRSDFPIQIHIVD